MLDVARPNESATETKTRSYDRKMQREDRKVFFLLLLSTIDDSASGKPLPDASFFSAWRECKIKAIRFPRYIVL